MAAKRAKALKAKEEITWKEAVELAVKYYKPVLDKLREYDKKK